MKYEVKDEKNCKKVISVIVEEKEVKEAEDKVFEKYKNNARIDGFRKGKVPGDVIKTQFKEAIKEDVLKEVVPSTYSQVIKELDLHAVTYPALRDVKYEDSRENSISYKIILEINPEFEIGDYKNFKIKGKKAVEVKDADIDREINKIRQYRGTLKDADRDEVKDGDYVGVSLVGFVDNSAQPELAADNQIIRIGSKTSVGDLEEKIKGMKLGQEKDIDIAFPPDYQNKKFAGKKALFKVKVKNIKILDLPELNDEFVKSIGKYSTVEEFKNTVKQALAKQAAEEAKDFTVGQITKKLLEANNFEIPDGLVEQEIQNIVYRYEEYLKQQGLTIEKAGMKLDELRKTSRKQAEDNIRLIYILRKIAEKENINIKDEDVENEIKRIATENGQDTDAMIKQAKAKGDWEALKAKLQEDRVIDRMIEISG